MIEVLSSPNGRAYLNPIKSAITAHMRPSAHILRLKDPFDNWTPMDHLFAETYQRMQDEVCPNCGNAVWLCRSRDANLTFKLQYDTCRSEAAKESPQAKKHKMKPGEFAYTIPEMRFGKPFPTRGQYFKDLDEEWKLHHRSEATSEKR